jgi:hypothetical protein
MNAATVPNVIAIEDVEFFKNAAGLMCFWSLQGDVTLAALTAALEAQGSKATPPDDVSATVALHRACDSVSKLLKLKVLTIKRGEYALTGSPVVDGKVVSYAVNVTAKIVDGVPVLEGDGVEQIQAAFDAAKQVLASTDIGTWLCDKLRGLKAVPLRDRGGVYFVPANLRDKWLKVQRAVQACSQHKIHTVPAMKSADAIDAILAALTSDTAQSVQEIDEEIRSGKIGKRALKHREETARELRERVAHYEALLGVKLGELRASLDTVEGSIASAVLAAAAGDDE